MSAPPKLAGQNSAFAIVLIICAAGVGATAIEPSHWLRGVLIIAVGLAVGAVARVLLPESQLGLLAVRGRTIDALCLGGLAVLIVTVGVLIPH